MNDTYRDDGATFALHGTAFVAVFRQPMHVGLVPEMRRLANELGRRHGEGTVAISVVTSSAIAFMSSELREESAAIARESPRLAAAIVIEGESFAVAMTRAAISAVMLVARNPYPHKIFGTLEEATAWLRTQAKGKGVEVAADLDAAVKAAR